jgi:DNA (cytosine-5)-methyltransferase 1
VSAIRAYYNEHDAYAAQWIRNLIAAGLVMAGDVDERSIVDVRPDDLAGYTRCHFFAGIAAWDYALQLAGWPAERPVWTGSCPCQPFSAAGQGRGTSDERHLWPALFHHVEQRRPPKFFGEQVASKDGLDWLDLVLSDLEGAGYDVAAADLCAASVGAPHIRQRSYFVANAGGQRCDGEPARLRQPEEARRHQADRAETAWGSEAHGVAHASRERSHRVEASAECRGVSRPEIGGSTCIVGDAARGQQRWVRKPSPSIRRELPPGGPGAWGNLIWLPCRDGKARPTEPGIFPLAHGASARVGRLRAYGNAIVPQAAAAFIGAYLDARPAREVTA